MLLKAPLRTLAERRTNVAAENLTFLGFYMSRFLEFSFLCFVFMSSLALAFTETEISKSLAQEAQNTDAIKDLVKDALDSQQRHHAALQSGNVLLIEGDSWFDFANLGYRR